jgi:hypothetical protein
VPQLAGYLQELEIPVTPTIPIVLTSDHNPREAGYTARRSTTAQVPDHNPHSLYHILYQLYIYGAEPCLPQPMRHWIQRRISWMESKANPVDLAGLQDTVRRQLWCVSPVDKDKQ